MQAGGHRARGTVGARGSTSGPRPVPCAPCDRGAPIEDRSRLRAGQRCCRLATSRVDPEARRLSRRPPGGILDPCEGAAAGGAAHRHPRAMEIRPWATSRPSLMRSCCSSWGSWGPSSARRRGDAPPAAGTGAADGSRPPMPPTTPRPDPDRTPPPRRRAGGGECNRCRVAVNAPGRDPGPGWYDPTSGAARVAPRGGEGRPVRRQLRPLFRCAGMRALISRFTWPSSRGDRQAPQLAADVAG